MMLDFELYLSQYQQDVVILELRVFTQHAGELDPIGERPVLY